MTAEITTFFSLPDSIWRMRADVAFLGLAVCIMAPIAMLVAVGAIQRWWHERAARTLRDAAEQSLVSPSALRPGMRANLTQFRSPGGEVTARISSITKRVIEATVANNGSFRTGEPVQIVAMDKSGPLRFACTILDALPRGNDLVLRMKMPAWIERIQRREYFRVPINEPTQVMVYSLNTGDATPICAMILDLSGTGARIATQQALTPNAFVRIHLPCDTLGGAGMDARVLQCEPHRGAGGLDHVSQCRFLAVTEETTSALLQACWKRERDHHLGHKAQS